MGVPFLLGVSRTGERGGDAVRTVRLSENETHRLAVEQARAKFSHGVVSGRCDDDVCHLHSKHASIQR